MRQCKFCAKASFLGFAHRACRAAHRRAKAEITDLAGRIVEGDELTGLVAQIKKVAEAGFVDSHEMQTAVADGWSFSVDQALDDGVLTEEEEASLWKIADQFSLLDKVEVSEAEGRVKKGAILRNMLNGVMPEPDTLAYTPFNLQKSEKIIWLFPDTDYYEKKKQTQYVGGTQGMSFRVAKGVYYRVGGFKGERVETYETTHADTGLLGITNKHIYFTGPEKSFRIRFDKIVSFQPYRDGIGLQRDAASAKPQLFVTEDGWFTYNLIVNVAQQLNS